MSDIRGQDDRLAGGARGAPRRKPGRAGARPVEALPPPERLWSRPGVLATCLALAVALLYAFHLLLPRGVAVGLVDKVGVTYPASVDNFTWIAFFIGLGELLIRHGDARAEDAELKRSYLPEDERTILQPPELVGIYQAATTAAQSGNRFLPRLIRRVVLQFQTSRQVDQAHAVLGASLDLYLHEIDLRYSLTRYVIWVIPTLGFIGTVMGISLALEYVGNADLQDPKLLAGLTRELAVAFNTTLLALVLSAVLVLLQHVVQAREERALNRAGEYCLDNLINRLYDK